MFLDLNIGEPNKACVSGKFILPIRIRKADNTYKDLSGITAGKGRISKAEAPGVTKEVDYDAGESDLANGLIVYIWVGTDLALTAGTYKLGIDMSSGGVQFAFGKGDIELISYVEAAP